MAPSAKLTCPECGTPVGPGTGTDPYKHTIHCFHLEPRGAEALLADHRDQDNDRSRRIVRALRQAEAF